MVITFTIWTLTIYHLPFTIYHLPFGHVLFTIYIYSIVMRNRIFLLGALLVMALTAFGQTMVSPETLAKRAKERT